MPTWQEWREMAESSLADARILLARDQHRGAISRAYYAAYQMVTAILVKLGTTLPAGRNNWDHDTTQILYWYAISNRRTSKHAQLMGLRIAFNDLLQMRITADYRPHLEVTAEKVGSLVAKAGSLLGVLHELLDNDEV